MRICVTKRDIKEGKSLNSFHCPIALAMKRRTGVTVGIGYNTIRLHNMCYFLPEKAHEFMKEFDFASKWHKSRMKPFHFELVEDTAFYAI